jgi:excinuclease ABC subunit B
MEQMRARPDHRRRNRHHKQGQDPRLVQQGKKVALPGQNLDGAQTVGISATVKALEDIILHGRKEVEGNTAWMPHRPAPREKSEGGIPFKLVTPYEPAATSPPPSPSSSKASTMARPTRCCSASPARARPSPSRRSSCAPSARRSSSRPTRPSPPSSMASSRASSPNNAVEYFVSYYDYYQPEAYVPRTDTYIEKESTINEQIDRMRHSATRALLERDDVIIVASVSCIYGIGSVEDYTAMTFDLRKGQPSTSASCCAAWWQLQYKRGDAGFTRGTFRVRGDTVELFPAHYEDAAWRITLFGNEIESIAEFDPLTGKKSRDLQASASSPIRTTSRRAPRSQAPSSDQAELAARLQELNGAGRFLEAQRLEQRTCSISK